MKAVLLTFKTNEFHVSPFKLQPASARLLSASLRPRVPLSPEERLEKARARASNALLDRKLRAGRFVNRVVAARAALTAVETESAAAIAQRLERANERRAASLRLKLDRLAEEHERIAAIRSSQAAPADSKVIEERLEQANERRTTNLRKRLERLSEEHERIAAIRASLRAAANESSEVMTRRLEEANARRSSNLRKRLERLSEEHERVLTIRTSLQAARAESSEAMAARLEDAHARRSINLRKRLERLADEHERVERVASAKLIERLAQRLASEAEVENKLDRASERRRGMETLRLSFSNVDSVRVEAVRQAKTERLELRKRLIDAKLNAAAERRDKRLKRRAARAGTQAAMLLSLAKSTGPAAGVKSTEGMASENKAAAEAPVL